MDHEKCEKRILILFGWLIDRSMDESMERIMKRTENKGLALIGRLANFSIWSFNFKLIEKYQHWEVSPIGLRPRAHLTHKTPRFQYIRHVCTCCTFPRHSATRRTLKTMLSTQICRFISFTEIRKYFLRMGHKKTKSKCKKKNGLDSKLAIY